MSAESRANGTTPEQIEADIERQRDELASTVDALQARLDVKARARHKADDLRARATTSQGRPRPELIGGAVAVLAVLGGLVALRRRRTR
jgi:MYXO-CTERM domain-containing protein